MPITEITALISSAKAAYDIAKGINSLNVDVERNQAVSKIIEILLSVQSDALVMQSNYQELLREKDELLKKLIEFEQWEKTETEHHLEEIVKGVFAYSLNNSNDTNKPKPWLCANCWQDKKKSILQADWHTETSAAYTCPRCKTQINMKFSSPSPGIRHRRKDSYL